MSIVSRMLTVSKVDQGLECQTWEIIKDRQK